MYLSVILGVIASSSFWSILELFQQKKRVERGWFPKKSQTEVGLPTYMVAKNRTTTLIHPNKSNNKQ
jgi:hypothetical protein